MSRCTSAILLVVALAPQLAAADWPMKDSNAARSAYTSDALPAELAPAWTYHALHAPEPAWPRDTRMRFDRAFHVVVAEDTVFFGSSADGVVYALDAATGNEKWSFVTDAPVRFAPVVWKDRLFVGSDDGYLYCLSTRDGSLIHKWRGGPRDDRVLGNSRMVGRWPVRGGPVIYNDVLYWAAGIWQSEGIYIYAMNPDNGKILWVNDDSGGIYMPQPHGGANAKSGVTAQGYLVATDEHLLVPTGRAVPAVFNRKDGKFKYYKLQKNTKRGGTPTMAAGPFFYNGGYGYQVNDGALRSSLGRGATAAFSDAAFSNAPFSEVVLHGGSGRVRALRVVEKTVKDRKGIAVTALDHEQLWSVKAAAGGELIVAANSIISAGGGRIDAIDMKAKKVTWSGEVDGIVYGLAAADGRLYVSTDRGVIHCFTAKTNRAKTNKTPIVHRQELVKAPYGSNDFFAQAAEEILEKTSVREGYCIDLGCGDGALAYELARRSDLFIYAIDSDPDKVAIARRNLRAAGLYGQRVTVHLGDPAESHYPRYVANLAVSGRSVVEGAEAVPNKEMARLTRPYGGKRCIGRPGEMQTKTRGALAKAGSWSHQYSNAANTLCSTDEIKGPLRVLWYRDVDLEMPSRHGRGPSPLFHQGRIFAEGMDALRAIDAYNGRPIWNFPLPGILHAYSADHIVGVSQTGSNYCAADDSVYVRTENICYRLDAATGKVLGTFKTPPRVDGKPGRWGYIACIDGILYGSVVNEKHIVRHAWKRADKEMKQLFTESLLLFALDAKTGALMWRYDAKNSIRNNAIAIGDGRVFLIDRPRAIKDLLSRVAARRGQKSKKSQPKHPTGELLCLDAKTGREKWSTKDDIFGTMLAFSEKYDMLLMSYQSTSFRLPSEVGGRMAVFRAGEGYRAWDEKVNYKTRPLVNDRMIFALGAARDLLTGEAKPFDWKKSYGCGQLASGKNLMLFRSATLGYIDLTRDAGVENFGGVRPGCWVNALPAGGLVLLPDASAKCTCSYQNRSWVAFQGSE